MTLTSLIEEHIDAAGGRAYARLKRVGVSVAAIVESLALYHDDRRSVRESFDVTEAEFDAALAYYARHRKYIEARILLNSDGTD